MAVIVFGFWGILLICLLITLVDNIKNNTPKAKEEALKAAERIRKRDETLKSISEKPVHKKIEKFLTDPSTEYMIISEIIEELNDNKIRVIAKFSGKFVFTDEMWFSYKTYPGFEKGLITKKPFAIQKCVHEYTSQKQKSVVGNAIVVGAIAGGAGAVVGAIHAANVNVKGGKTVTHRYETGDYFMTCNGEYCDECYVNARFKELDCSFNCGVKDNFVKYKFRNGSYKDMSALASYLNSKIMIKPY